MSSIVMCYDAKTTNPMHTDVLELIQLHMYNNPHVPTPNTPHLINTQHSLDIISILGWDSGGSLTSGLINRVAFAVCP